MMRCAFGEKDAVISSRIMSIDMRVNERRSDTMAMCVVQAKDEDSRVESSQLELLFVLIVNIAVHGGERHYLI